MKEVVYIKKNKDRWDRFEAFVKGHTRLNADELAKFYIELTADLSYAKTFYSDSKLVPYLNKLATAAHQSIYKNKKEDKSRIPTFFKIELFEAILRSHRALRTACIIFIAAIGIGIVSTAVDSEFVNLILGDSYVNMTLDNIENGDPMAVYKGSEANFMFIRIGSNNIRVALLAFAVGILASVFTGFILFSNGVMVGAFLYFFVQQKLFWLAFSTIFIHGALELSAIVIAGGAGFVVGNAWLFPGTYARLVGLRKGIRQGLKVIIGLIPVFVIAALLESFVTRHYLEIGSLGRASIIAISFMFILWFYVIHPLKLKKDGKISIE